MSTEKYKIYLPSETKARLENDAELFEFLKANSEVSLNAFMKALLINYVSEYSHRNAALHDAIGQVLCSEAELSDLKANALTSQILSIIETQRVNKSSKNSPISLTVSGQAYEVIQYILSSCLKGGSLSQYLRNMFESYLDLPRSSRERIIFKDVVDVLEEAILRKKKVSFIGRFTNASASVIPYKIASSKEESFNYLLCYDSAEKTVRSYRVSRLGHPIIEPEDVELPGEAMEALEAAETNAPQFSFQSVVMSCVHLTEEGKKKYRMIYTNRPLLHHREGNDYYFEWPLIQLEEYFKRFGKEAIICEPVESQENMRRYYQAAYASYSN